MFHRGDRSWPLFGTIPKDLIQSETILTLDHKTGNIINPWVTNLFMMPDGLAVGDEEDNLWVTDVALH